MAPIANSDADLALGGLVAGLDAILWEAEASTWQFTFVSQGAESVLGYPVQMWLTNPSFWLDHVHSLDRQQAELTRKVATAKGKNHKSEYRAIAADGRIVWLSDIVQVVKDEAGKPRQLRGVTLDITDRKQAEDVLRSSAERYRMLFETNLVPVALVTPEGQLVDCNLACARMFGYDSRAEFLDETPWDLLWKRADRKRLIDSFRQKGSCNGSEIHFRRRDKSSIWVLASASWTRGTVGQPDLVQATMIDVTEQKNAELRLRRVSEHILNSEDEDRRRIAKDLRDTTLQELAALKMNLAVIKKSGPRLGRKASQALAECRALAEKCGQEVRASSHLLYPLLLDEFGLISALRSYREGLRQTSGLRLRLLADGRLQRERLPKDLETTLFRVVQEGLANVRLHSGSQTAEVKLRRVNDPDQIVLQVKDSGRGMPARVMRAIGAGQMAPSGLGIPGMMERTRQLGGQLTVETSKRGTVLTARVPLLQKGKSTLSVTSKRPT